MKAEWVIGRFTGMPAKNILGIANAGVGYYVLERPDHGEGWCLVAFRRATDRPRPDHLQLVIDERLLKKLNEWLYGAIPEHQRKAAV